MGTFYNMKVLYFSLYLVSASATRTVDEIYQPEQKVVYGTDWEVNTPFKNYKREEIEKIIVKKNRNWLSKLRKNPEQLKVVEWMTLSLKSLPITPNTISKLDDDDFCWILFFYDSNNHKDETGLKSLFRTTNEMFYERCGVGTVDISFPSNHLMFSKTIKNMNYFGSKNQFPFIIFKKPYVLHRISGPQPICGAYMTLTTGDDFILMIILHLIRSMLSIK